MVGDAEATRRRLLEAAAIEFADYGIAGARVDRIASAALSNKAQIYHYFKNKEGLFDAVMTELAREIVQETPLNPAKLPEYAGQLFDRFDNDPIKSRLANWYRLEGTDHKAVRAVLASTKDKVEAIDAAQRDGVVSTRFEALEVLALVVHLSTLWSSMTPEMDQLAAVTTTQRRREVVVDAVRALLRD